MPKYSLIYHYKLNYTDKCVSKHIVLFQCDLIRWASIQQNDFKDLLVNIESTYHLAYSLEGQDELLCR